MNFIKERSVYQIDVTKIKAGDFVSYQHQGTSETTQGFVTFTSNNYLIITEPSEWLNSATTRTIYADDLVKGRYELTKLATAPAICRENVPDMVWYTLAKYNSLQEALTEEYYNNSSEEVDNDHIACWIDRHFDWYCQLWLQYKEAH